MSIATTFTKKILARPELAQLVFKTSVLDKYLQENGTTVSRTNSVGRVKASSWSADFGIAPDENTLHLSVMLFTQKVPEREQEHWLSHLDEAHFSENFLKMQSAHSCIDDGAYRGWGESAEEALF